MKEGDIYILVILEWLLKKVLFNLLKVKDFFVVVIFVVDLNVIILDVLRMVNCNKEGLCNEVWIIENVKKWY